MPWNKESLYAVAQKLTEEIHPTLPAGLKLTVILVGENDKDEFNAAMASALDLHTLFHCLMECSSEVWDLMESGQEESPEQFLVKDEKPS